MVMGGVGLPAVFYFIHIYETMFCVVDKDSDDDDTV